VLVDCLTVAIMVAALVDLALPWWHYFDGHLDHSVTGWGALPDSTWGQGWGLLAAVVLTGAAAASRRRWAAITGALVGAFGAAVVLIGAANLQGGGYDEAHAMPGLWTGGVLALLTAAGQVVAAVALSRS
jgi:hypothetical protein